MNALLNVLQTAGIFIAGIIFRFGILVGVLLLLTAVFLIGLGVVRLVLALRRSLMGLGVADGLFWKRKGYYAPGHTWLEAKNGQMRIGFDDLAQKVLGHVTAITLPPPGAKLKEGDTLTEVACGDRHAVIPSPISGTVVAINDRVIRDPGRIHRDPYRYGWLVAVEADNSAYARFLWGQPARKWLHEESIRLSRFLEQELQLHAADGGELTAPGASLLETAQWQAMMGSFLKAK